MYKRQGFLCREGDPSLWEVDMSAPTVLIQNLETTIQDDRNFPEVMQVVSPISLNRCSDTGRVVEERIPVFVDKTSMRI